MTNTNKKERTVILVAVASIALGMFTVGSSYAASSLWGIGSAQISIDKAASIGTTYLKTNPDNLNSIAIEKDDESFIYNLEFAIQDKQVSVEIDPHTGKVLHDTEEPLDTESNSASDRADTSEPNDGKSTSDGDGETDDD